jgi:hypothetical protein
MLLLRNLARGTVLLGRGAGCSDIFTSYLCRCWHLRGASGDYYRARRLHRAHSWRCCGAPSASACLR